jgi:hypothetical protein
MLLRTRPWERRDQLREQHAGSQAGIHRVVEWLHSRVHSVYGGGIAAFVPVTKGKVCVHHTTVRRIRVPSVWGGVVRQAIHTRFRVDTVPR